MRTNRIFLPDREKGRIDFGRISRLEQIGTYIKHGLRGNCNLYEGYIPEVEVIEGSIEEGKIELRVEMGDGDWFITVARELEGEEIDGY